MEILENPILIFLALGLIIILLVSNLYLLKAKILLLENRTLGLEGLVQNKFHELKETITISFTKAEQSALNNSTAVIKDTFEKIETSQQEINNCVANTYKEIEESLLKLLESQNKKAIDSSSLIHSKIEVSNKALKDSIADIEELIEGVGKNTLKGISDFDEVLSECLESIVKSISVSEEKGRDELIEVKSYIAQKLESEVLSQIQRIIGRVDTNAENTKALIKESLDDVSREVQSIRVSNILTENRNLYNQGRLVLETDSFIKTFDNCQLNEIVDKETGQITKNEYKKGELVVSKTYRTDTLEYIGYYENGVLQKMEDRSVAEGGIVTSYTYDEAGEVESVEEN